MGRSIARHSNSRKNFYIYWMEEMSVEPGSYQHAWAWGDFKRSVKRALRDISDTFDTPYEETWLEDEVMLLMENGHAKIVVSEYVGLACVGIVSQPMIRDNSWGHATEEPNFLSINYCDNTLEPKLEDRLSIMYDLYRAGATASNGGQVFHKA